jgi:uncharacterized membrane protein
MSLDRTRIGRSLFAVGLVALAIEHFVFADFVSGRAPAWPSSIPGGTVWAYTSGLLLMVSGGTILCGQRGRGAAVMAAILIGAWALFRHIPVLAGVPFFSAAWTPAGKALTFTGGALAVAATFPNASAPSDSALARLVNRRQEFVWAGRASLALFFVITGIQHFMFTEFVASLIPGWFPGNATVWTYFAGVALIAGGLGLFLPQTAALAGLLSGLMVFSWFWIVHLPRTSKESATALPFLRRSRYPVSRSWSPDTSRAAWRHPSPNRIGRCLASQPPRREFET